MVKNKEISEQKTVASSYIVSFYTHIQYLNDHYANYENVLLELQSKYGSAVDRDTVLEDDERRVLLQNAQNVRYYVHRTYIGYNTILKGLKNVKMPEKIKELWKKIKDQFIVNRKDILEYVMAINDALQSKVMQELLTKSSDIIEGIYGTGQDKKGVE